MANIIPTHALTVSALTLAAAALSGCSAQGFGHGSSYAGANCNAALAAAACSGRYGQASYDTQDHGQYAANSYGGIQSAQRSTSSGKSRYGNTSYQIAGYDEQYYMQQQMQPQMMLRPAPFAQPSYSTQAADTSYQTPSYDIELFDQPIASTTSYSSTPAACPAGTTAQTDGTCLQGDSMSTSSYTASYTPTSSYSGGYITGGETANCPAGTTASSDGTCLQGGAASTYSGPSYSAASTIGSASSALTAPPISTYDWGSQDTTWGSDSYVSPGTRIVDSHNSYPSVTTSATPSYGYMPTRK